MNSNNPGEGTKSYVGQGRGLTSPAEGCLCNRPRCFVLCNVCGYAVWGRVCYQCPEHPKTTFLCDIMQCPICQAARSMLTESSPQ